MDLNGTWRVKTTSGPLWFRSLNLLRDKKIIYGDRGHNFMSGVKWGKFTISKEDKEIVLTYTDQPIIDKVRVVHKNKLSGKFYLSGRYIGNFDMVREAPQQGETKNGQNNRRICD